jgi:CBS domain-containing protein
MSKSENPTRTMNRADALGLTVGEVMLPTPKTLPPTATVGDVRRLFERRGVRTLLIAEDASFRGAIDRATIPASAGDSELAVMYAALRPVHATPAMPMSQAVELLEQLPEPRLIVLDEDGITLRGLVCAKPDGATFCVTG